MWLVATYRSPPVWTLQGSPYPWAGAILHQSPCDDAQGTCWPGSSELSPHNQFLSLTRPRPFLTLSAWFAPRLGQISLQLPWAPCFAVLGPAHPGMVQGPCWTGRAEWVMLHSLLCRQTPQKTQKTKKTRVGNIGEHPGARHFLSMFWEKATAIFVPPQGGTKAIITHHHGQLLLSTWQMPFG